MKNIYNFNITHIVQLVKDENRHFDIEPIGCMVEKRNLPFCKETKESNYKFSTTEDCVGCGICSKMCSSGNIEMVDKKPQWKHDCQMCLACFHNCPQKAIKYDGRGEEIPHYHHPQYSLAEKEKYSK